MVICLIVFSFSLFFFVKLFNCVYCPMIDFPFPRYFLRCPPLDVEFPAICIEFALHRTPSFEYDGFSRPPSLSFPPNPRKGLGSSPNWIPIKIPFHEAAATALIMCHICSVVNSSFINLSICLNNLIILEEKKTEKKRKKQRKTLNLLRRKTHSWNGTIWILISEKFKVHRYPSSPLTPSNNKLLLINYWQITVIHYIQIIPKIFKIDQETGKKKLKLIWNYL